MNLIKSIHLFLLVPMLLHAETASTSEPQEEVGYVRVWHFADTVAPRLHFSATRSGGTALSLGRSVIPGRMLAYRPMQPGRYVVQAISADESQNEIARLASVELEKDSFLTLLLRQTPSGPAFTVLDDVYVSENKSAKRLRVFQFASGHRPSLKSTDVFIPAMDEGYTEQIFQRNPGRLGFQMSHRLPNGRDSTQTTEINFQSSASATIVIFFDRYGSLTVRAKNDAILED